MLAYCHRGDTLFQPARETPVSTRSLDHRWAVISISRNIAFPGEPIKSNKWPGPRAALGRLPCPRQSSGAIRRGRTLHGRRNEVAEKSARLSAATHRLKQWRRGLSLAAALSAVAAAAEQGGAFSLHLSIWPSLIIPAAPRAGPPPGPSELRSSFFAAAPLPPATPV